MKIPWINDTLETKRCILKLAEESEAEYTWSLISPNITKYMLWEKWKDYSSTLKNIQKSRKDSLKKKSFDAAIYLKESWKIIWRCWIISVNKQSNSVEFWYWLSESYWWVWIMPECIDRLLQYVFLESCFEKAIIRCDKENTNSSRVAIKCWFTFEWCFRKYEKRDGVLRDTNFYWILKEGYSIK